MNGRQARHVVATLASRPLHSSLLISSSAAAVLCLLTVSGLRSGVESQLQRLIDDWRKQGHIAAYGRLRTDVDGRLTEKNSIEPADLAALTSLLGRQTTFYPSFIMPVRLDLAGRHHDIDVRAAGTAYFRLCEWFTRFGDSLQMEDDAEVAKVAVIGRKAAQDWFVEPRRAVGQTIRLNGMPFVIKGVLEPRSGVLGDDYDSEVFIPVSTMTRRLFRIDGLRGIGYALAPGAQEDVLRTEIRRILRAQHHLRPDQGDDFTITDPVALRRMYAGAFRTKELLGYAISLIAAIIAAGVITNITALSITQRRQEIGLKRALGAAVRDVVTETFLETALVAVGGAVLAGVLYLIPLYVIPRQTTIAPGFASFPLAFSWSTALQAAAFGLLIGAAAGILPARRVAQLNPVDALRP